MKTGTIKINGKGYKYSFKQKARRLFMEKNGLEYFDEYADKLKLTEPHPEKGISMPGMYVFADLVLTAIQSEDPDFSDFDSDELIDVLLEAPELMQKIMESFVASSEQQTNVKKVDPSSSGKKSKRA